MRHYYEKIVVAKGIVDVWRYEKLNVNGGGKKDGTGEFKLENYRKRMNKRRRVIRELICTNFDSHSKFVTLTFDNERDFSVKDVKACNAYFKRFVQRTKTRYPEFRYVAVIEFQDKNGRGAVHYHMICNLPFVKKAELREIWGAGHVKINAIDHVDNVGAYVVKYMVADMDDLRLQGLHAYLHSRSLDKPTELCTWRPADESEWQVMHDTLAKEKPTYERTYVSDAAGVIEYRQFNFNRILSQTDTKVNIAD